MLRKHGQLREALKAENRKSDTIIKAMSQQSASSPDLEGIQVFLTQGISFLT
jgi:hypothetical protein